WQIGVRGDYRRTFWRFALARLRAGELEHLIHIAVVSHHLIQFTRDCLRGAGESSFYAPAPAAWTGAAQPDSSWTGAVRADNGARAVRRMPRVPPSHDDRYGAGELQARTSHTAT